MHQQSIGTAAQSRSQAHQHVTQVPRFAQRFDDVTQAIHATLHDAQLQIAPNLFRVNAGVDLFDVYLGQFDPADRQSHNCNCCRSFIHRFGSLVTIYQDGRIKSAIWDETKLGSRHPYRKVVKALREAYGPAVDWMDLDAIADYWDDPQVSEAAFRRYFLNQPVAMVEKPTSILPRWGGCRYGRSRGQRDVAVLRPSRCGSPPETFFGHRWERRLKQDAVGVSAGFATW